MLTVRRALVVASVVSVVAAGCGGCGADPTGAEDAGVIDDGGTGGGTESDAGGGGGGGGVGGGSGGGDAGGEVIDSGVRAVTLTGSMTYHLLNATSAEPLALSAADWALLVAESDGGFVRFAGTDSDAGIRFADVPFGEYYAVGGATAFVASGDLLDLSREDVGRTQVVYAGAGTRLVLNVTGFLAGGTSSSHSVLAVPHLELRGSQTIDANPWTGATSHTYDFPWSGTLPNGTTRFPLLDAARGDWVFVVQSRFVDAGIPLTATAIDRGAQISATLTDGTPQTYSASLAQGTPRTVSIEWRRDSFNQSTALARISGHGLELLGIPGAPVRTWHNTSLYSVSSGLGVAPDGGFSFSATFHDPFDNSWSRVALGHASHYQSVNLPDGGTGGRICLVESWSNLKLNGPNVVEMRLGPATNLQINGVAATAPSTGVGESPLISWTAPALGAPTSYLVVIAEPRAGSSRTVLELYSAGTSIRVPPGFLQPNTTYILHVKAMDGAGVTAEAPYARRATYDTSCAAAAPFSP